jgi:hypothetical protein
VDWNADGTAVTHKKAFNVEGITHIHFDEIYLCTVRQLAWIGQFMRKHKDTITFTMAGDPGQNLPPGQTLIDPSGAFFDAYYEKILAQLFPRRLTLRVSKRCKTEEERHFMRALCDALADETISVYETLQQFKLTQVEFLELTESDAEVGASGLPRHVAALRSTMDKVDHWAHAAVGDSYQDEYLEGQILLGVDGCRAKGGRIASNERYTVAEVSETHLSVTDPNGSTRTLTLKAAKRYLKRPYCMTGHASQGLTLGDKIYIHDWKSHMATHRWMRTAVSRCCGTDIVLVNGSAGVKVRHFDVKQRIAGHRAADAERAFAFEEGNYVDVQWAKNKVRSQHHSCYWCNASLDQDWSIDRVCNARPHEKANCVIACRHCQNASGHRA